MYDVLIIGGGVTGCLAARELSRYQLEICLLTGDSDVAMGASGANSGIVHAGYDPRPGTLKARLNAEGNALYGKLSRELDIPFVKKGSLVLAFDGAEEKKLEELMDNGRKNGVLGLLLLGKDEVRAMEPLLPETVTRALYAPSAGVTCPYSLTIAAAENAVANGVHLFRNQKVVGIERKDGVFSVRTRTDVFAARFVVNAAGVYADEVSSMAGAESYAITPRKGEYILFDNTAVKPEHVLFQAPARHGKGILVTATAHGNLIAGPTAEDVSDKEDTSVSGEGLAHIAKCARRAFPHIDLKLAIAQFSGLRAVSSARDFIIEPSRMQKGFIHIAGISSPGLTAAPAIAKRAADILADEGLPLREKKDFNPIRKGIPCFRELSDRERNELIRQNPLYGRIVCRCELVSEAEVIESIRRPAGALTLDGVKRRLRAGMGRCQGGFCSSAVLQILSRELGIPPEAVTKRGPGSEILARRTK